MESHTGLVLLEDLIDFYPPSGESFVLVAHNFSVLDGKWDLGFIDLIPEDKPKKVSWENFYLIPLWYYDTFDEDKTYNKILKCLGGETPFSRYLVKSGKGNDPALIEREDQLLHQIGYGITNLTDIQKVDGLTAYRIHKLIEEKEKVILNFF